jgi:hypothetical protein
MLVLDYEINPSSKIDVWVKDYDVSNLSLYELHFSNVFIGNLIIKDSETGVDFSDLTGFEPILYFTEVVVMIADNLAESDEDIYNYPDDGNEFYFHRTGNEVVITSSTSEGSIEVQYDDFKRMSKDMFIKSYDEFCKMYSDAINSPALRDQVRLTYERLLSDSE